MNQSFHSDESINRRLRAEFEQLGLWPVQFIDSDDKPDVDLNVLKRLARRELHSSSAKLIYQLVARYRDWYEAYVGILANER